MTATLKTAAFLALGLVGILLPATEASATIVLPQRTYGARVTGVVPNSPANRVGIEIGDVIVAIDGFPVAGTDDFNLLTAGKRRVVLTVRDGRTGAYVLTESPVVNGRIGVRFVITAVPTPVVPYGR